MKKLILFISFSCTISLQAQTLLTHSSNQNVWSANSAACTTSGPGTIHNNSFIRVFDTDDFNIQDTAFFLYIELGVESASGGAYDLIGRVHELNGTLLFSNMSLLAADTAAIFPDSTIYKMNIPLEDGYALPGDTLVTEVFAALNGAIIFFPGSNPYVETSPSYIAAPGCGLLEPTEYSTIGFPTAHLILNLWVNQKPVLNDLALSVFKNNVLNFQKADFDGAMNDYDADTIDLIRIETLPTAGDLELDGVAVSAGDTIYSHELALLTYTPNTNYYGNDNYAVRVMDANHWANNTSQVNITVFNWMAGIEEQTKEGFSIFPNPANDVITLTSAAKIQGVRVFDSKGSEQRVKVTKDTRLDISELPDGIYFVMVTTDSGISVEKFLKQ